VGILLSVVGAIEVALTGGNDTADRNIIPVNSSNWTDPGWFNNYTFRLMWN